MSEYTQMDYALNKFEEAGVEAHNELVTHVAALHAAIDTDYDSVIAKIEDLHDVVSHIFGTFMGLYSHHSTVQTLEMIKREF